MLPSLHFIPKSAYLQFTRTINKMHRLQTQSTCLLKPYKFGGNLADEIKKRYHQIHETTSRTAIEVATRHPLRKNISQTQILSITVQFTLLNTAPCHTPLKRNDDKPDFKWQIANIIDHRLVGCVGAVALCWLSRVWVLWRAECPLRYLRGQ